MADSVQNRRTQQTYLRQVQQEKAARKRELMQAQTDDIKTVREYYADANKKLDEQTTATVNHIKEESRQIALAERQERSERIQQEANQKKADRMEQAQRNAKYNEERVEMRNTYSRGPNGQNRNNGNAKANERVNGKFSNTNPDQEAFYKVEDRGNTVREYQNSYTIDAYAPEHEKDNVQVAVHQNKAVISGQRKFADEVQDGDKTLRTNNFQTFREEIKLDKPVSTEGMTRERIGDFVRFSIPKADLDEG